MGANFFLAFYHLVVKISYSKSAKYFKEKGTVVKHLAKEVGKQNLYSKAILRSLIEPRVLLILIYSLTLVGIIVIFLKIEDSYLYSPLLSYNINIIAIKYM